jgi:DMSO/TMAO reductase YedYZ molybdopterin-dependent catalytic subunit
MSEPTMGAVSMEELQLATRNHGMPLEALRYPVTPVGLHYLLIHYDIPAVDPTTWHLRVDGSVSQRLELSLAELRAMPATTRNLTMECAGNGRALLDQRPASQPWLVEAVGTGSWTGVELNAVLTAADVQPVAEEILFTGADRGLEGGVEQSYQRSVPLDVATSSGVLLAYDLNGAPLPPQHGFPLRLLVPGWYGMTNVKWLTTITAVDAPFTGYQQTTAYRLRQTEDDVGQPVSLMAPRSLMVPPGIPDFFTRARHVQPGINELTGRAWSGIAPILSVEVSTDGGMRWDAADLDAEPDDVAMWRGWRFSWDAEPGDHELCCRATDRAGEVQPLQPEWNRGGYANNAVQRLPVHVADQSAR